MSEIHHYWYDEETMTPRRCDDPVAWDLWFAQHDAALARTRVEDIDLSIVFDPHVSSDDPLPMPFVVSVYSQYSGATARFATFAAAKKYFLATAESTRQVHSLVRNTLQ